MRHAAMPTSYVTAYKLLVQWTLAAVCFSVRQETFKSTIFEVEPQSLNVTEGGRATYFCTPNATSGYQFVGVTWTVNGTFLNQLGQEGQHITENNGDGNLQSELNIANVGVNNLNNTFVECVAITGTAGFLRSRKALLFVQGVLGPVLNITTQLIETSTLLLSWTAPFTLDISNTELDMTFCVHVFNHSGQHLVHSVCGINETQYSFTVEQLGASPCDAFEFRVIAFNGAGEGKNGSSLTVGYFYPSPLNFSVSTDVSFLPGTSEIKIALDILSTPVCDCNVYLTSKQTNTTTEHTPDDCSIDSMVIHVSSEYQDNFYDIIVQISNSAGQAYSDGFLEISTYDIQDACVNTTTQTDLIKIELLFARNSQATGALIVFAPISHGSQIMTYSAVRKTGGDAHQLAYLMLPPSGVYNIFIYDIERNGLPKSRPSPAFVINEVDVTDASAFVEILTSPNIQVSSRNGSVCVGCSVSSTSDALGCVAIVHSLQDLSSIVVREIHKNSTQPQCIEDHINEGNYSVAVFEWKSSGRMSSEPVTVMNVVISTSSTWLQATESDIIMRTDISSENVDNFNMMLIVIVSGSVGTACVLVIGLVVVICIVLMLVKRKHKSQKLCIQALPQGGKKILHDAVTMKQISLNDNPAYGTCSKRQQRSERSTKHDYEYIQDPNTTTNVIYESV